MGYGHGYGLGYTTQVAKYPTFCRVNALHRETKGETIPIFLPCKRKTKVGYGTLLVYLTCAFTRQKDGYGKHLGTYPTR